MSRYRFFLLIVFPRKTLETTSRDRSRLNSRARGFYTISDKQIATPLDGRSSSGFDRGERFQAACRAISHRNGCPARTSMALPMPTTVSETTSCALPAKQLVNGQSSNLEKPSNHGYMVVDLKRGQRGLQAELSTVLSKPITTHVSLWSGTPGSEKSSYTSPR